MVFIGCAKKDGIRGVSLIDPLEKCIDGFAGEYPCNDYDLLAHIPLSELNDSSAGNDCWGWTDPISGNEYALMGSNKTLTFINITNPIAPVILGFLDTQTVSSSWRDVKVFNNFAFIVSEASNHGMQVFDLKRLRNLENIPVTFSNDALYSGFGNAHNIIINEQSGFAYAVGTRTFSGGPHFVDINDPNNPVAAGGFSGGGYSHDAQVIIYNGPDSDYTGKEILIGSNENEIVIADVTDKASPIIISTIGYQNIGYTHQGWFTENQKYFILGDELDERNFGGNTKAIVFDFTDLDNPVYHTEYIGPTSAIDHNGYVKGNTYFQANYTAGVRMIDIRNIESKELTEIGHFDTFPDNDIANFRGAWNVYPFFPSGNIIISDINNGFFIIRKSGT